MNVRKKFFYNTGGEELKQVAQRGGGVDALSLETPKVRLDGALST